MKKILFFGSEGYIGSHLVREQLFRKYQVIGYDVYDKPYKSKLENYQKIDITNLSQLKELDFDVDYIYYFSGVTGTNVSIENYDKFIEVNEKGLMNVLTTIRNKKVYPKMIFPSTRLVYKGSKNLLLSEDSEKEFKTIYALNKFHNECALKIFNTCYNIPFTIFRIGVPYGNMLSDNYSYGTIGFFLNNAKNKINITLFGDGELRRTFTFIGDICKQILEVSEAKQSNGQIYNIGGETYSLKEVATMIAGKYNIEVEHVEWPALALALESGNTVFSSKKIEKIYKNKYFSLEKWINKI